jgi:hypothetical protein
MAMSNSEHTSPLKYRGFYIPGQIPSCLIEDFAEKKSTDRSPFWDFASPLVHRVVLDVIGRDVEWGMKDAEALPDGVKEAGIAVRGRQGICGTHNDALVFIPKSETPKGMRQMPDPYRLARYHKGIEFPEEMVSCGPQAWTLSTREDDLPSREQTYIWLPQTGNAKNPRYIVPTGEGAYHRVTGTPFETIEGREEAIERWREAGLTREEAERELSTFRIMGPEPIGYSRLVAVDSLSLHGDPLCIVLRSYDLPSDMNLQPSLYSRIRGGPGIRESKGY